MKRLSVLLLTTVLTGCITSNPTDITAIVTQIQNTTIQLCGYYPTAASLTTLITTLLGGNAVIAIQIEQIAQTLCNGAGMITPTPTPVPGQVPVPTVVPTNQPIKYRAFTSRPVTILVNGVKVSGHFVR